MFEIGEKVICVDDSKQPHTVEELTKDVPNWVKKGEKYTIRGIQDHDFVVALLLEEISNPLKYFRLVNKVLEPGFMTSRFEKIVEKEEYVFEENVNFV